MNILADFHHSGAARAQVLVFERWGHAIWFPSPAFVEEQTKKGMAPGVLLPCLPGWLTDMGDTKAGPWHAVYDSEEEILSADWDVFLCTRLETQDMFKRLRAAHPHGGKIKMVFLTGNDAVRWDYEGYPNLMSSDLATYRLAPPDIHKVHYSQEIGENYFPSIAGSNPSVHCYINCWPTFDYQWSWDGDGGLNGGACPHCQNEIRAVHPKVSPWGIWDAASRAVPQARWRSYGINCVDGCLKERDMPDAYRSSMLTFHMKTYDGYGFSMLQSIACGVPVIVPRGFYRYRTAGQYLIEGRTSFEVAWSAEDVARVVRYMLDPGNRREVAETCRAASKFLFHWEYEAWKVNKFLEDLR